MGKDDHTESFGYPPEKEDKKEGKETVEVKSEAPKQRPHLRKLLYFPMAFGTAGLAYSIYFVITFLTFGSVESFYPWEWQITFSNSSMVLVIFAVSVAISLAMLVPSSIQFDRTPKIQIAESTVPNQDAPEESQSPEGNLGTLTIDELARDLKESKATAKELKTHIARVETVLEKKIEDLGLPTKLPGPAFKKEKEHRAEKVESSNSKKTQEQLPVPKSALERRMERRADSRSALAASFHDADLEQGADS